MIHNIFPQGASEGISLVQQLLKRADINHDGQVTTAEFNALLNEAITAPGDEGADAVFRDRLNGFDMTRLSQEPANAKEAFATRAQFVAPSAANLQRLVRELGDANGSLDADGVTYRLGGSNGFVGVRNRGYGPVWQWMAADDRGKV